MISKKQLIDLIIETYNTIYSPFFPTQLKDNNKTTHFNKLIINVKYVPIIKSLLDYLQSNNIAGHINMAKNQIFIERITDNIVKALALNIPEDWIDMECYLEDQGNSKKIKVKGSVPQAMQLLQINPNSLK